MAAGPGRAALVSDKANTVTSCVDSNLRVRIYDNAAVVTGLSIQSGTIRDTAFKDRQILFTETFVMKNGRWQDVAGQGTGIYCLLTPALRLGLI